MPGRATHTGRLAARLFLALVVVVAVACGDDAAPPATDAAPTGSVAPGTAAVPTTVAEPAVVVVEGSQIQESQVRLPAGSGGILRFENRDDAAYPIFVRTRPEQRLELPAGGSLDVDFSDYPPDRYNVTVQIGNLRTIVAVDTRASTTSPEVLCDLAADIAAARADVEARLADVADGLGAATTPQDYLAAFRAFTSGFEVSGALIEYGFAWEELGSRLDQERSADAALVAGWASAASGAFHSDWPNQARQALTADMDAASAAAARVGAHVGERCGGELEETPVLVDVAPVVAALVAPAGVVEPIPRPDRAAWKGVLDYQVEPAEGGSVLVSIAFDVRYVRSEGTIAGIEVRSDGQLLNAFELAHNGRETYVRQEGQPWEVPDASLVAIASGLEILDPFFNLSYDAYTAAAGVEPEPRGGSLVFDLTDTLNARGLLASTGFELGDVATATLVTAPDTNQIESLALSAGVVDDRGFGDVFAPGASLTGLGVAVEVLAVGNPSISVDFPAGAGGG